MKKILLLICLKLTFNEAHAQITLHPTVGGNMHGLVIYRPEGYSEYYPEDIEYFKSYRKSASHMKPGFQIGLSADIPLSDRFSFEPGLRFIKKGFLYKTEWNIDGYHHKEDDKLNIRYLEIPLMFNFNTEVGDGILSVTAGPSFGLQMGGSYHIKMESDIYGNSDEVIKNGTGDEEIQDYYDALFKGNADDGGLKRYEISAYLGVRYEINQMTFGVTYGQGLSSWLYDDDGEFNNEKSQVLQLNVGYKFEL
jgi:hypothetical protein